MTDKPADKAAEVIARGDCGAILAMALNAHQKASEGVFCECAVPSLHGDDLMCGNCLLENRAQRDRRLAKINGPHKFEPMDESGIKAGFCKVCVRLADDPRHAPCPECDGRGEVEENVTDIDGSWTSRMEPCTSCSPVPPAPTGSADEGWY